MSFSEKTTTLFIQTEIGFTSSVCRTNYSIYIRRQIQKSKCVFARGMCAISFLGLDKVARPDQILLREKDGRMGHQGNDSYRKITGNGEVGEKLK